ncbi:MAG: type IV fimbrial biogenesis protein FimT [Cellvibrionaceae bacterium]|jgi:type IV fimbrial biogenesis protein FimT
MKRNHSTGFTLINLLITLTISGILATAGLPSLQILLNNQQANNTYQQLFTLVQFTRIQSVNYSGQVLLCPTVNQNDCINDWNQELMVFVDTNYDETKNDSELLLQVRQAASDDEQINWRASGSRRYLRFKADGSTGNQNGRLTYCLRKEEALYARQIIMYRTGRARRGGEHDAKQSC